jgi:hypothetical protein
MPGEEEEYLKSWARHANRMGERRDLKERDHLGDVGLDEKILLKLILKHNILPEVVIV